jgi:hypothetical protein
MQFSGDLPYDRIIHDARGVLFPRRADTHQNIYHSRNDDNTPQGKPLNPRAIQNTGGIRL